jgi:CRISPR-associated protein Cas2
MFVLICYDVETLTNHGKRRLRKLAKACESKGQRVQKSLFECKLEKATYLEFENYLLKIIDPKKDSLRIYHIDEDGVKKIKNFGITEVLDFEDPLIL